MSLGTAGAYLLFAHGLELSHWSMGDATCSSGKGELLMFLVECDSLFG